MQNTMQKNITLLSILLFLLILIVLFFVLKKPEKSPSPESKPVASFKTKEYKRVCTDKKAIDLSKISKSSELKSLADFQNVCNSFLTDKKMTFIGLPISVKSAKSLAVHTSKILKEFAKFKITPVVVVEPFHNGTILNIKKLTKGGYNTAISEFFKELKKLGITDPEMGIWVPFPEANTPSMDYPRRTPEDFSLSINTYTDILRQFFPNTHVTLLLDSKSYKPNDSKWNNGIYKSYKKYISGINPGAVNSIGIQGFPWKSEKDSADEDTESAKDFLQTSLIIEAAEILDLDEIWFNTGTFYGSHLSDTKTAVYLTAKERSEILQSIIKEVLRVKEQGFKVWINIFSEDKSDTKEARNWSYFGAELSKEHGDIFVDFAQELYKNNIPLSIF